MFKFDAQTAFLTYPQATIASNELYQFLNSLEPILWARIAQETHESGEPHVHVIVKFRKRFQSRNERVFDFNEYHPNIQSARNPSACLQYCEKEGNFTDYGEIPRSQQAKRARLELEKVFELASGEDYSAYLRECAESGVGYGYCKAIWSSKHSTNERDIPMDFLPEGTISGLLSVLSVPRTGPSVTVIIGPTGCGKTTWAKREIPKPALLVSQIESLKYFKPGYHKGIVFDDMSFTHMPRESQIHLTDWHEARDIYCRYGNVLIPAHTPKIFTANSLPFSEDPAIIRRISLLNFN